MSRWLSALRLIRFFGSSFCVAVLLALALVQGPAAADTPGASNSVPGAGAPAFVAALAAWLADDEAQPLSELAALAQSGNAAARLLLSQIDRTPALQGPFLAHTARAERIALLRMPGGLSGRNWLDSIDGLPLADALRDLRRIDADATLIDTFTALDEPRAAREAMTTLAARESPSLAGLAPESTDVDLLYLLWRGADPQRRAQIAALVPPGHPQRQLMGESVDARDLDRWLAQAAAAAPLETLCAARCPEALAACRTAAYRALDSHNALLTLGTPAETLVAQQAFLASPRGQSSMLRRILLSVPMRGRRAMLARVADVSACLGTELTAEVARYRRPVPRVNDDG